LGAYGSLLGFLGFLVGSFVGYGIKAFMVGKAAGETLQRITELEKGHDKLEAAITASRAEFKEQHKSLEGILHAFIEKTYQEIRVVREQLTAIIKKPLRGDYHD
jgi:predicted  nucleic acid-binding Zn-ribbon protein